MTTDPHANRSVERHPSGAISVTTRGACPCHPNRVSQVVRIPPERAADYDRATKKDG